MATRGVLTSKQGNKNFYKGTGGGRMGRWNTRRGTFILEEWRFRQYVVPDLEGFKLTSYVSKEANSKYRNAHHFTDYFKYEHFPNSQEMSGQVKMETAFVRSQEFKESIQNEDKPKSQLEERCFSAADRAHTIMTLPKRRPVEQPFNLRKYLNYA